MRKKLCDPNLPIKEAAVIAGEIVRNTRRGHAWNVLVLRVDASTEEMRFEGYGMLDANSRREPETFDFLARRAEGNLIRYLFSRRETVKDSRGDGPFVASFRGPENVWISEALTRRGYFQREDYDRILYLYGNFYESYRETIRTLRTRYEICWCFWFRLPPHTFAKLFEHFFRSSNRNGLVVESEH